VADVAVLAADVAGLVAPVGNPDLSGNKKAGGAPFAVGRLTAPTKVHAAMEATTRTMNVIMIDPDA
jgi:hypothetical protein